MKLAEVQFQAWHPLVAPFYVCQACSRVDTDHDRTRVGSPCKHCGAKGRATPHFGLNARVLVNSIQDFYFLRRATPPADAGGMAVCVHTNRTDTRIVIPLLFCTLCELLTSQLCRNLMRAKALDEPLQERLLAGHRYAIDKRDKLFPALTGEKWNEALAKLTKADGLNYTEHFKFFLAVNGKRNRFIHEGARPQRFTAEELDRIPEELRTMFSLFAELHNRYVPEWLKNNQAHPVKG